MVLNFPVNPTVGTIYLAPSGVKYVYDGIKWSGQVAVTVSDQLLYTTSTVIFSTVRITDTESSTDLNSGALRVAGGAAIQDNMFVAGVGYFGLPSAVGLENPLAIFTDDVNAYTQIQIQNISAGTSASSDFIATSDVGTDASNYIDMGINNSQFVSGSWTVSGGNDGYLYVNGGNITVGTDTPGKTVKIHVGGIQESDVVAVFRDPQTDSFSEFTGALTVSGSVGVSGNIHVRDIVHVGPVSGIDFQNPVVAAGGSIDGYVQVHLQNLSPGYSASSDFVATTNDGDDETHYIDMGINNSGYSSADWTVSGAHDGYLYVNSGNLTLGTDTPDYNIRFHVGGTLAENIVTELNATGTVSTSSTTGAVVIHGGLGVDGDINAPRVFTTPIVPYYADEAARDAVPGALRGSIILVGNEFQGFNGFVWVTLG